ncbi:hypothetical protein B0H66DRAFT_522890 [Apodospora peruviana]|uniref:MOSC domain-containing protein n=1 Tax=Apodospora peruviana TaxID=516989 RepID=A0AAE0HW65_9PEZI|nr:hypothetical protein B0H66DRAFT_522890 [Apodospora peruviana]
MKITALYVYPIKALRGISITHAELGAQGIKYDRRFMLYNRRPNGELRHMQLSSYPQCALLEQEIVTAEDGTAQTILVQYRPPPPSEDSPSSANSSIKVPLEPDISSLEKATVDLHGSPTAAYRMGECYDEWFTACLGVPTMMVYIGDGKRAILGNTLLPKTGQQSSQPPQAQKGGWISSLASYVNSQPQASSPPAPWLTFTDLAPFLITSEASLRDVSTRLPEDQPLDMYKFRPNIVVDGEGKDSWDEDFWAELTVGARRQKLLLTGNCVRCTSLNVDYQTGRPADGELGTVLKKLMKDRRVDPGMKWSPVFGRYASLHRGDGANEETATICVGDEVEVTGRNAERSGKYLPAQNSPGYT